MGVSSSKNCDYHTDFNLLYNLINIMNIFNYVINMNYYLINSLCNILNASHNDTFFKSTITRNLLYKTVLIIEKTYNVLHMNDFFLQNRKNLVKSVKFSFSCITNEGI